MSKFERGLLTYSDPGKDKPLQELPTSQCVHCGGHFVMVKGSGIVRGFCPMCNGLTCGPHCSKKCVPTEQLLENIENGRPLDFRPVMSPVIWSPAG